MKKAPIYIDTSAYLCVLLGEVLSQKIQKVLMGARLFTSTVLFLEAGRCLVRLARQQLLSGKNYTVLSHRLQSDVPLFATKDLTLEIALNPQYPAITFPRSLDLVHLKTALWFQKKEPEISFLTLDLDQRQAARELGLQVITP